jgi:hypothetical protein
MKDNPFLPYYHSSKIVQAAKIVGLDTNRGMLALDKGLELEVPFAYFTKHQPHIGGYYVLYKDGYESFSPAEAFEESCVRCEDITDGHDLTFGEAIEALKSGLCVTRKGWNGKGMYLWLLPAAMVKAEWCKEPHLHALAVENGGEIECLGSIRMYTVNAEGRRAILTGWLASQTDMLAEDWMIME